MRLQHTPRTFAVGAALLCLGMMMTACNLDLKLPAGTSDPATFNTPEGAIALYRNTLTRFSTAFQNVILATGEWTDELAYLSPNGNNTDSRQGVAGAQGGGSSYNDLQKVRAQSIQAIGTFTKYASDLTPAYRGELYALQGYAVLFLADLYCSGVPLSVIVFEHTFTYKPGSSTNELYRAAVALFDTAETLSQDSVRLVSLARVGKGRAYLALGLLDSAANTVASVPQEFSYVVPVMYNRGLGWVVSVADRDGQNGLPFRSSADPRIVVDSVGRARGGSSTFSYDFGNVYWPRNYALGASKPAVVASGIEARLIVAEALLRQEEVGAWLDTLNVLRQTAIVPVLDPLTDPGADPLPAGKSATDVRVDRMFYERAFWLFLTGHRQGDLRRFVRQYDRLTDMIYPIGQYFYANTPDARYGSEVTISIPDDELTNPLFNGCLSREP